MERTKKSRRVTKAAIATLAAAALVLTGTFAWQSISQEALNEAVVDVNPGGRLHDDFNGKNKDIYVENFTSKEDNGVDIYARIRLDEYMELGPDAGTVADEGVERKATSLIDNAVFEDVTTWSTYKPDQNNPMEPATKSEDDPEYDPEMTDNSDIHEYWDWTLGGQTVYLPTFNMNKDSLAADINGTFAGIDENPNTDADRYGDYKSYVAEVEVPGIEVYDNDTDDEDEGTSAVEDVDIISVEDAKHTTKNTLEGTVISMKQWKEERNSEPGLYWVYDTDGWAYWANPIRPGEATGLFLDQIDMTKTPDENWYYGINVVAQFATKGDWGYGEGTGFYNLTEGTEPTDDALRLLGIISEMESEATITAADNATTVAPGGTLNFTAMLTEAGAGLQKQPTDWKWEVTVEDVTALEEGDEVTGDDNSAPGSFDWVDPEKTDQVTLKVNENVPRGTVLVITAEGTVPVDDETTDDGTTGGETPDGETPDDETPDDETPDSEENNGTETFEDTTEDGTTPSTMTGTIKITVYEELDVDISGTAAQGEKVTLTASSAPTIAEKVRWTVNGKADAGTTIVGAEDGTATLTIAEGEDATKLTVKVKYFNDAGKVVADGELEITVSEAEQTDPEESTDTGDDSGDSEQP